MQINWFTVIAQVINFLVLVWLMKKYLYKPILDAVDAREKKIADELADAANKMSEAKKEQEDFKQKNVAFDQQKKELMDKATSDAENERQKLLDAAKQEASDVKQKLEDASKELQKNLNDQLSQKTQQEVLSITKKVLAELASTNLDEQTVHVFIQKMNTLSEKDKKQFTDAFQSDSNPITINSAFELTEQQKQSIQVAIAAILGDGRTYTFTTDPKMIGGVELSTNGYKLSWSFSAYIHSLEKSIASKTPETTEAATK
jgi:F-type H+-transporting ATPase subunit b